MITIREYVESDAKALWDIHFYTIRNVNLRDYSQEQIEAWAPDCLRFLSLEKANVWLITICC